MVARHGSKPVPQLLLRVRAAKKVRLPLPERPLATHHAARAEVLAVAIGLVAALVLDAQLIFSAGRVISELVYIPLVLLPLHAVAGAVALVVVVQRYVRALQMPLVPRCIAHPYAALLTDPRWPLWSAAERAREQYFALQDWLRLCVPAPRSEMARAILGVAHAHLCEADQEIVYLAQFDGRERALEPWHLARAARLAATLEQDARVMEAFRVNSVG